MIIGTESRKMQLDRYPFLSLFLRSRWMIQWNNISFDIIIIIVYVVRGRARVQVIKHLVLGGLHMCVWLNGISSPR